MKTLDRIVLIVGTCILLMTLTIIGTIIWVIVRFS